MDFGILKKLAEETNGDLAVTSELKKLDKVCVLDNVAIPAHAQGATSVRIKRLLRRLGQNEFCRGLVPRSDSELLQGATLAELHFPLRVSGVLVFSDSDDTHDRSVLEGILKDAPGAVPSFDVFESPAKQAVRVNATRPEVNKFYDMGFKMEQKETEVAALQRQLAEMAASREADKNKSNSNRKGSKKVKPRKVPGKGTEVGAALVAGKIGGVHAYAFEFVVNSALSQSRVLI